MKLSTTKTQRLLQSFAAVELLPEHRNWGDETPALRDFGFAPSIATALIRWGEQHSLVCTFEDAQGRSNNTYHWKPEFLAAAVSKHLELFGEAGKSDLPESLLAYVSTSQMPPKLNRDQHNRLRCCGLLTPSSAFSGLVRLEDGRYVSPQCRLNIQ